MNACGVRSTNGRPKQTPRRDRIKEEAVRATRSVLFRTAITLVPEFAVSTSLSACASRDQQTAPSTVNPVDSGAPACRPHTVLFTREEPAAGGDAGMPSCSLDSQRGLIMSYNVNCDDRVDGSTGRQWQTCTFGHADFSLFDPNEQARGVLEARLCIAADAGTAHGAIDIWYDRGGGERRFLSVLASGGSLAPGCVTKFWTPADSCKSMGQCGDTGCDGGTCTSFQSSDLELTSEYCAQSSSATIVLQSITYYPESCLCKLDKDCPYPQVCRYDGYWLDAHCRQDGNGCPGICQN